MCGILRKLGQGAFGKVYLLQLNTGDQYALKVADTSRLPGNKNSQAQAVAEAKLMHKFCHAHLVQCCSFFIRDSELFLITEFCYNGTLNSYLLKQSNPVKEPLVLMWLSQMADALRYLHAFNVIHRDMKTDNVFLDKQYSVKVGDLGIARELSHTADKANTVIGTLLYMSPEVFQGSPYTTKADIWGLGCCAHEVMTRCPTFKGKSFIDIMTNITQRIIPPMPELYSKKLQALVMAILDNNEDTRPDALKVLHSVIQIQGRRYEPGEHKPLGKIDIDEQKICTAVQAYERRPSSSVKNEHRRRQTQEHDSEQSNEEAEEDSDTVKERKYRLRKQKQGNHSAEFQTNDEIDGTDDYSLDSFEDTDTESSESESKTVRPCTSFPVIGMDQNYMDKLAMESRQWLRTRFAPDKGYERSKPKHRTSDPDSSSDSESLVTLFTRAQKVKYINKKSRSGATGTGTEFCDLGQLSPEISEAAKNVIQLFRHQDKHLMEMMLIQVMGFRDFTLYGRALVDRMLMET